MSDSAMQQPLKGITSGQLRALAAIAARGAIKLASERQRTRIQALTEELGWDSDKARHWLAERHGIRSLARGIFSSAAASAAITQLGEALKKRAGIDRGPPG